MPVYALAVLTPLVILGSALLPPASARPVGAIRAVAARKAQVTFAVGSARFEVVRIPAGHFEMGSSPHEHGHESGEGLARHVHISHAFYLGKYEVTQGQYRAVMGVVEGSHYHGDSYPMDSVPNAHAAMFCQKLSHLTGLHVVLPTEAQWEYACRAGTKTRFYTGDGETDLARAGWYRGNSEERLHEVGGEEPNAFGLYDMLGNVGEMCADEVSDYAAMAATDPKGDVQDYRTALRGGPGCFPPRTAAALPRPSPTA